MDSPRLQRDCPPASVLSFHCGPGLGLRSWPVCLCPKASTRPRTEDGRLHQENHFNFVYLIQSPWKLMVPGIPLSCGSLTSHLQSPDDPLMHLSFIHQTFQAEGQPHVLGVQGRANPVELCPHTSLRSFQQAQQCQSNILSQNLTCDSEQKQFQFKITGLMD